MSASHGVPSAEMLALARSLDVDRITGDVVEALRGAGIHTLLLKGPVLAALLYEDGAGRHYADCDLLVPLEEHGQAERVLSSLNFVRDTSDDHFESRFGPPHASPWIRESDGGIVDLHRALSGMRLGASDVWQEVARNPVTMRVGGTEVQVPRPAACALIVALHAAHHEVGEMPYTLEDLSRAIERLPFETWVEAGEIADALHSVPPFALGLRLLPPGRELADRLRMPSADLVEASLGRGPGGRTALGFERLAARPGLRAKAGLVLEELFPSPRFMRWWTPVARRGRRGLAVAYVWRVAWLLLHAVPGIRGWRRSRGSKATGDLTR